MGIANAVSLLLRGAQQLTEGGSLISPVTNFAMSQSKRFNKPANLVSYEY